MIMCEVQEKKRSERIKNIVMKWLSTLIISFSNSFLLDDFNKFVLYHYIARYDFITFKQEKFRSTETLVNGIFLFDRSALRPV